MKEEKRKERREEKKTGRKGRREERREGGFIWDYIEFMHQSEDFRLCCSNMSSTPQTNLVSLHLFTYFTIVRFFESSLLA